MSRYISSKETAVLVREALQKAFPTLPKRFFSVRVKKYSVGSSITVEWINGPTDEQVKPILDFFNGVIPLRMAGQRHTSMFHGEEVCFGINGVSGERKLTEPFVRRVADAFARKFAPNESIPIVVSEHDGRAWVDRHNKYASDLAPLMRLCSEDMLDHLQIGLVNGRFAILGPGVQEDVHAPVVYKKGLVSKIGARMLGDEKLAGEIVTYREVRKEGGALFAEKITHPTRSIIDASVPLNGAGINDVPECIGTLTRVGAGTLSVSGLSWKIVRYNEHLQADGTVTAVNIFCNGNSVFGSTEIGYNGILPKQVGRSFHWAGPSIHYDIIKEINQLYHRDWVDSIEVTIVDENGEETCCFSFSWYLIDNEKKMKLEMPGESLEFLRSYPDLFRRLESSGRSPYTIAQLLEIDFGFVRREHA